MSDFKKIGRRELLATIPSLAAVGYLSSTAIGNAANNRENQSKILNEKVNSVGVVVSTHPTRGLYHTSDFESDVQAVQTAYDDMVTNPNLPKTLILDSSARPFEFDGYLDIWQSQCRITGTGGPTIIPAQGYTGPLIQSEIREATKVGEDNLITDVIMDNIWIDGKNQSFGIRLRHLQLSTIHSLHVRSTNGPGLWISDCCIENLFANLILSDNCGSEDYPALLIEPEYVSKTKDIRPRNETINSTQFSGIMIHFPTTDALRISAGPVPIAESRRQRKMQFVGCMFHGHSRQRKPLVTLSEAFENTFIGTQMLIWRDEGTIVQMGEKEAQWPAGITMFSHCIFLGKPESNTTAIKMVNVDTGSPCAAIFGNTFGSSYSGYRLAHAVDWGAQRGKLVSWAGNTVRTSKEAHTGVLPKNADLAPF